jgi:hypothetical protein
MISEPTAAGLDTEEYLLGVVHYHDRVYYAPDPMHQHFLIKIEPRPPFRVLQVCALPDRQLLHY